MAQTASPKAKCCVAYLTPLSFISSSPAICAPLKPMHFCTVLPAWCCTTRYALFGALPLTQAAPAPPPALEPPTLEQPARMRKTRPASPALAGLRSSRIRLPPGGPRPFRAENRFLAARKEPPVPRGGHLDAAPGRSPGSWIDVLGPAFPAPWAAPVAISAAEDSPFTVAGQRRIQHRLPLTRGDLDLCFALCREPGRPVAQVSDRHSINVIVMT